MTHLPLVDIILITAAVISCYPQLGSAFSVPWQTVGSVGGVSSESVSSCPSTENSRLHIGTNVSSILTGLMRAPQCGDGLWYQVAYLDMSDSAQQCPSNWREGSTPVRICGRPTTTTASCSGEYFSTRSLLYSKVCGRAIGYQHASADTFALRNPPHTIDDPYVDGVSVTHGIPRAHIWTYAVGNSEGKVSNFTTNCPCANPAASTAPPPSFVGDNYFCESGNSGNGVGTGAHFFENDPVWDGEDCEGDCCSNGKSPPWFSVILPNPTSDDIEVRICGDEGTQNEDTPIQLLEMYIQ